MDAMTHTPKTTRREFLKAAAVGLGTASVCLARPAKAQLPASRIIAVDSEAIRVDEAIDVRVLRRMVSEGIKLLTGARDAETAWKRIVVANDVVGIKVDARVPQLSTHPALVVEVIRGVVTAGVPPENVIVWDRFAQNLERYDYHLKALPEFGFEEPRGRILASEGGEGTIRRVGYDEAVFFDSEDDLPARREDDATVSFYSRIVTKLATRLICLPVMHYHPITGVYGTLAGLGLGSLSNTFRFHPKSADGMLMIADVWRDSVLTEKHALTIVDGLTGAYNTGPGYDPKWLWEANRLFVSRDPVAADTLTLQEVNGQRKPPLKTVTKEIAYLRRAASYGIGSNDPEEIEQETIEVT